MNMTDIFLQICYRCCDNIVIKNCDSPNINLQLQYVQCHLLGLSQTSVTTKSLQWTMSHLSLWRVKERLSP